MPALALVFALMGMPFDPAWLPCDMGMIGSCSTLESQPSLYCHYAWIIPVYEGKDAPGEAQMFRLCELGK